MLLKVFDNEDRQDWIDVCTVRRNELGVAASCLRERRKFHEENACSENPARRADRGPCPVPSRTLVSGRRYDPDDFDDSPGLISPPLVMPAAAGASISACGELVAEMHPLSKRIAFRPQFFREDFIDDRDRRSAGLGRFRRRKCAAAQQWQPDRLEIIRADAVPVRIESEPLRGGGGPSVRSRLSSGALHGFS